MSLRVFEQTNPFLVTTFMGPFFEKIAHYINPIHLFKKEKGDLNLRAMHTINKISMLMFLICIIVLAIRHFNR
jgi:hypothetical protein